ncbi:hypothetical protein GCM10010320_80810 [Streptomyces caelestis]|nr:hypothetical protein GCM10010320_80810 [Streptomyces caelestis]
MCARCGAKFTDDRWAQMCGPCADTASARAEAERGARRQAEEAATRAATERPAPKSRGVFGIGPRR